MEKLATLHAYITKRMWKDPLYTVYSVTHDEQGANEDRSKIFGVSNMPASQLIQFIWQTLFMWPNAADMVNVSIFNESNLNIGSSIFMADENWNPVLHGWVSLM